MAGRGYGPRTVSVARRFYSGRIEPKDFAFAGRHLLPGWSVVDRLAQIRVPTLVMAGHDDFLYPPESQAQLAAGIPNAQLRIIERAGHNPQSEQPAETIQAVRDFLSVKAAAALAVEHPRTSADGHVLVPRSAGNTIHARARGRLETVTSNNRGGLSRPALAC